MAALATAVLATAIAGGVASTAGAERAHVLGKTRVTPKPNCSGKAAAECQIIGQVTAFQRRAAGKSNLFKAPQTGKIVAWSVDLARPSKDEREVFGEAARTQAFGEKPTAGIGILRKDGKGKFKLLRSSPILPVQRYYGQRPVVTLAQPLHIRKGDIVALTTVTWLPNFSVKRPARNDVWVASRTRKQCTVPDSVPNDEKLEWYFDNTRPHRKDGTTRNYRCAYQDARVLYWAYFVPAG